jgi:hypothetical protein
MGIYDRDYYKERQEGRKSPKIFTFVRWLAIAFFFLAFAVYVLAIFSNH